MQKARFEVDPHNRLVIDGSGRESDLPAFRKVLDGQFKIDKDNNLSYHVKSPLSKDEDIPHQIRLKGEWSLTDDHYLRLTLDKWGRQTFGDRMTLKGEIIDVNENSLLFAVTTTAKDNTRSTYVLNLGGSWKADKDNRLSFHVRKEGGRAGILIFNAAWDIDKNRRIIYEYERSAGPKSKPRTHTLIFKGWWDIKERFRISYVLSGSTGSAFDFRTSAGIFKDGSIKYEAGIGLAGRAKPRTRTIMLTGRWNLKKDVGLEFEVKYEAGKTRAVTFGADLRLAGRDTVSVRLRKGADNKDLGLELELSRRIFEGEGEVFLNALASRDESVVYAGAAWRW